jgi:predicted NBD/HSP70 family sugar kinase
MERKESVMAHATDPTEYGHAGLLTEADEMSLAQSRARQTDDSVPDTLDVRSDAVAVLQDSMEPLRRPTQAALAALALSLVVIVGGGLLARLMRHRGPTPAL